MHTAKHAYLILAHKNWNQLRKLVEFLDDEGNDIYIHIDKKSQIGEDTLEMIMMAAGKSKVCFVDSVDVRWGDYSVVEAELKLHRAAVAENYQYFHLVSGMDFPLKPQAEIHVFLIGTSVKNLSNFSTIVFCKYFLEMATIRKLTVSNIYFVIIQERNLYEKTYVEK